MEAYLEVLTEQIKPAELLAEHLGSILLVAFFSLTVFFFLSQGRAVTNVESVTAVCHSES